MYVAVQSDYGYNINIGGVCMDKKEMIDYWVSSSDSDFITMNNLFKSKDFHWSLFIGHLVIEKLLKAVCLKEISDLNHPPRSHDLLLLADKAGINTNEQQKDDLDLITTFNISARYPDYKKSFYKKCNDTYTLDKIKKIKELRIWLKKILENK